MAPSQAGGLRVSLAWRLCSSNQNPNPHLKTLLLAVLFFLSLIGASLLPHLPVSSSTPFPPAPWPAAPFATSASQVSLSTARPCSPPCVSETSCNVTAQKTSSFGRWRPELALRFVRLDPILISPPGEVPGPTCCLAASLNSRPLFYRRCLRLIARLPPRLSGQERTPGIPRLEELIESHL